MKISFENTYFGGGEGKKYHRRDRDGAIRDRWVTTHGVLEKRKRRKFPSDAFCKYREHEFKKSEEIHKTILFASYLFKNNLWSIQYQTPKCR